MKQLNTSVGTEVLSKVIFEVNKKSQSKNKTTPCLYTQTGGRKGSKSAPPSLYELRQTEKPRD